jgi:putative effector of murein hydrolase
MPAFASAWLPWIEAFTGARLGVWISGSTIENMKTGLSSHGIATARAFQENEVAGTFAGLAMALNGIATAALVPLILELLDRGLAAK